MGQLVCMSTCPRSHPPSQSPNPGRGSTSSADCQPSAVIQVTCGSSSTGSKTCRSQLYASMGFVGPLRAASCMAHTTAAVTQWGVPVVFGMHTGQDTLNKASTLMLDFPTLFSIIESYNLKGWSSCNDSQCPALLYLKCRSGDCCQYKHQK